MARRCKILEEFAKAELGDVRRVRRLGLLASRLAARPEASIPSACRGWAETHAAYRLLNSEQLSNEEILRCHRQATLQRASATRDLLLLQDTTELDYRGHDALEGAGPLADGRKGFFAHTHLVVAEEEGVVLGLESCKFWARSESPRSKKQSAKKRAIEDKESLRWIEGYRKGQELLGELPANTRLTVVGDRESDIYELFMAAGNGGQKAPEFVVRASQDRALQQGSRLFETCRAAPLLGSYEFEVRAAELTPKIKGTRQRVSRQARRVSMEVRACKLTLRPPWRSASKELPPIELWVICAREKLPPEGQRPVEWILLTSWEVQDFAQARRLLRAYSLRWLCEEFHYVLKSGCRVQDLALRDSTAMLAAVSLYMVIAWRILYLRDFARAEPQHSSQDFFEPIEWRIAGVLLSEQLSGRGPPELKKMIGMIGRLGGHLGRTHDGQPGTKSLWMGLTRLSDAVFVQQKLAEEEQS